MAAGREVQGNRVVGCQGEGKGAAVVGAEDLAVVGAVEWAVQEVRRGS